MGWNANSERGDVKGRSGNANGERRQAGEAAGLQTRTPCSTPSKNGRENDPVRTEIHVATEKTKTDPF